MLQLNFLFSAKKDISYFPCFTSYMLIAGERDFDNLALLLHGAIG